LIRHCLARCGRQSPSLRINGSWHPNRLKTCEDYQRRCLQGHKYLTSGSHQSVGVDHQWLTRPPPKHLNSCPTPELATVRFKGLASPNEQTCRGEARASRSNTANAAKQRSVELPNARKGAYVWTAADPRPFQPNLGSFDSRAKLGPALRCVRGTLVTKGIIY